MERRVSKPIFFLKYMACVLFLLPLLQCSSKPPPPPSLDIYYIGEHLKGRVGEYMSATPRAKCPEGWSLGSAKLTRGHLPEGVTLSPGSGLIAGTPRVAGEYEIRIYFTGVKCGGKSRSNSYYTTRFPVARR